MMQYEVVSAFNKCFVMSNLGVVSLWSSGARREYEGKLGSLLRDYSGPLNTTTERALGTFFEPN
jgi:hypothetical protein